MTTETTYCKAQTADWSRCERPAVRRVEDIDYCEQHAKRTEKAIARAANPSIPTT